MLFLVSCELFVEFGTVFVVFLDFIAGLPADIAEVELVLGDSVLFVSQLGEGIGHQTRHNIPEETAKEHRIDNLERQRIQARFVRLILFNEHLLIVYDQEALKHGITVLLPRKRRIRRYRQHRERHKEPHPKHHQEYQLIQIFHHRQIHILQCLHLREQIEQVYTVIVRADEQPQYTDELVGDDGGVFNQQHAVELP